jgi:hypothetical protein
MRFHFLISVLSIPFMCIPAMASYEHMYRRSWGGYFENEPSWCHIEELSHPVAVDVDSERKVCVLSRDHLVRIDPFAPAPGLEFFDVSHTVVIQENGDLAIGFEDRFYVLNSVYHEVVVFGSNGELLFRIGGSASDEFQYPRGIASGPNGEIFVADALNKRIKVFDADGNYRRMWSSTDWDFDLPDKIAVSPEGHVFVLSMTDRQVSVFTIEGEPITTWGGKGSEPGQFGFPTGIDVDSNGIVYISDEVPRAIQVFNSGGELLDIVDGQNVGSLSDYHPQDVAVAPNGCVYLADMQCEILEFKRLERWVSFEFEILSQPHVPTTTLEPISPNPSAGDAAISFALALPARAKLAIYDVAGRLVKTIVDGDLEAGSHRVEWQGTDDSGQVNLPGVYFARLETEGFTQTRKILYLRER